MYEFLVGTKAFEADLRKEAKIEEAAPDNS